VYRSVAEVKQFAAQMLSERETDTVLGGSTALGDHNLLERWLVQSFDRFATWGDHRFYEDTIELTWGSGSSAEEGAVLYLPDYVSRILSIYPQSSVEPVEIIHAAEFDRNRPDIRSRDVLVEWGYYAVERDMAAAGTLTATSASGAPANGLQVRIEGLTNASPGYTQIERRLLWLEPGRPRPRPRSRQGLAGCALSTLCLERSRLRGPGSSPSPEAAGRWSG